MSKKINNKKTRINTHQKDDIKSPIKEIMFSIKLIYRLNYNSQLIAVTKLREYSIGRYQGV